MFIILPGVATGQTNPAALTLPVSQNWGATTFSSLPSGFAAWKGLSGSTITAQALAEGSAPSSDYTPLLTGTPSDGGQAGCYGYAPSGDGRLAILTSSNATYGVCQLAVAINTAGQSNIALTYDLVNVVANTRAVGAVCQYRIGTSGAWTTLSGTGNPYVQSGGTVGDTTAAAITLPAAAENQAVVQLRWATWRGSGSGNSSGFAIDNISITAGGAPSTPAISNVSVSGTAFFVGDAATVTVQLDGAPPAGTPATVSVASGAFGTSPVSVVISNPATSGTASVTMSNLGASWTADATAVSGCTGSATSASFAVTDVHTPTAYAGPDRIVTMNGSPVTTLMTDATADDPNGLTGLTYAWTPATGTGISGWTNRTGGVVDVTTPSDAAVTFSATGTYVLTLTVTDPSALTATDTVTITVITAPPPSGQYDPPSGYYDPARSGGVWLTGTALKTALTGIIDGHTVRSYDAAKQALQLLDRDPSNASNILLVYTGASVPKTWDIDVWNREHQWPDSLNGSGAADSDLFNLRACNPTVNSTRGNDPYGIGSGYWDPDHGAPDRGKCARAMFYMATRYTNLTLVNGQPGNLEMGDLAKLLEWHYAYNVDTWERRRNHLIWSSTDNPTYYQGNRNPYIDHPEFVWTIFGGGSNNSELYVGASDPADGASTATVGFQVIKNAAPPSQTVTLNKTGSNPTTYDVVTSGDVTTLTAGVAQTFIGGTQARSIDVSIASTATAGNKAGTITVDNTELSSGGTGKGSADGNDTISVTAAVLEHSNASFAGGSDSNALTIDFGTMPAGGTTTRSFSVYNLDVLTGLTVALDLDSVGGTGDTARLTTDLATFTNLAAGTSRGFTATLNPSAIGSYQAVYTLTVSDQNLPGALAGTSLVLTLRATVGTPKAGDFNLDGHVDAADRTVFTACVSGPAIPYTGDCAKADFDTDNDVDMDDFGVFQANFTGS